VGDEPFAVRPDFYGLRRRLCLHLPGVLLARGMGFRKPHSQEPRGRSRMASSGAYRYFRVNGRGVCHPAGDELLRVQAFLPRDDELQIGSTTVQRTCSSLFEITASLVTSCGGYSCLRNASRKGGGSLCSPWAIGSKNGRGSRPRDAALGHDIASHVQRRLRLS
jgi:hypothetical protein